MKASSRDSEANEKFHCEEEKTYKRTQISSAANKKSFKKKRQMRILRGTKGEAQREKKKYKDARIKKKEETR